MKNSDLHQKYVRLVTKQFLPINLRTFVICISLVLLVGLAGCKNVSDDAESITPAATNENVNDSSGADDNNAAEDQNNAPGSVTWATDQTNVLIRWYGREAAGLPVYEPELDNNPPTILPGSPSAPTLKVERRTLPGNTYEVIASGITRINDQSEAQDLIDSGDWWQEISTYVTNSQQIPAGEVNISNVYSAFDENPMAAEFWANSHHELALLLGMGFVDEELENGKKYQYRVSLEEANAETKIIGYTPHLKVGKQSDLPVEVYASSSAEEVFEADEIDESEVHDGNWLGDQAPRRWVNQSVYVGWKYPTQQNEESITASGYNIYRYAVDSDLEQIANTNPLKINSNPVLPGGSGQGWLQDQQGESLLIGFDSETQQNQYDLESPTPPQANEDVDVLPGYFAVDNEPDPELEGNQLYCYAIAPIDFFGNEGPKTPENHQNGIDGNCATFQSQLPPEPPSNLIGQIHNAQIELQWDVIDGADHYSVYRAEVQQGQPYPASPNQWADVSEFGDWAELEGIEDEDRVRFIDTSAASLPQNDQEEIDYWYRARTWDANGNRSPLSQPVFIFLRDSKAPDSPLISPPMDHGKDPAMATLINGPCIQIKVDPDTDPDTDFVQIYRRLEGGSYELIATIPADQFDDLAEWCDPSLAGVVGYGEVDYIAQAHDSDGNYSWSDEHTAIFGDGALFDAPVILDIVPEAAQAGVVVNKVTWLADIYPDYDKFHIYRFESNTDPETIPAQLTGMQANASVLADAQGQDVEDLGNGFVQAIFKDTGLVEGSSDYYYVVSAYRNSDQAEQYSDPVKALPSQTTGLPYSTRDVGRANWCSSHTYAQDVGVEINWDHRKTGYKQDCEQNKTSESLENINTGAHLIFRSRHKDFGYVQIAPVLGGTPHSDFENAEKFYSTSDTPSSDMGIAYLDEDASFGTYWYVVVTLDIDSGEPVTVTEPRSIKLEDLTGLPEDQFVSRKCRPEGPVELDTFTTPEKLIFGDGTSYKSVVIVCKWLRLSQTSRNTFTGFGEGYVEFVGSGQSSIFVGVTFDEIKVNADGTVYGGYAKSDHAPILINSNSGLEYSVENILLDSGSIPGSKADIKVLLDDSIFIVEGGEKSKTIELSGVSVTTDFGFEVKKALTNSVPAAAVVAVPDIPDDTWPEQLDWYLVMDELPLAFISKSLLISDKKITSSSSVIGRYFERFNNRGIVGPVDRKPLNTRVNSNDAVFQSTTFNVESFEITSDGVKGELISNSAVNYVPSIPYAASIKSQGVRFTLDGSSIVSGTLDPGSASTQYSSGPSDFNTQLLKSEFDNLKFGSGGLVTGDVTPTTEVSWYWGNFAIDPDEFENRALVIPPLYSSGLPAKSPVSLSNFTKLDSPYDQYQTLWDPIDTDPYWLMPGFNLSGIGRINWDCIGSDIPTEADLYVRQSGVTHAFSAQDGVGGITPDGYTLGLSKVDLGFLDSDIEYHKVGVEVDLPYPANFTFSGNVTDFDDGCIGEFANASGGTEVLADHWNLEMRPAVAEFLAVGNDQNRLFLNGGIKLPHNVNDQGTQVEWTPIKSRWEPEGLSKQTIFNQIPLISLQGISYLLKSESGVMLRNPAVGEIPADPEPAIDTFSNVVDRPDCLECPGWISYNGTITVPYFGKLISTNNPQSADIELHVFTNHDETNNSCNTCSDYIGSSGISANQTWISEAGLELDYPLVISKNNGFGLTLVGVDRLAVLPGELEEWLEIITLDTSTVIESKLDQGSVESNTGLFIGLSSVPAVVKAVTDSLAINENAELPPSGENGMDRWFTKFVGNDKPISDKTFDLYTGSEDVDGAPGCTSVLEAIWGDGDWNYNSVYGRVNIAVEDATGCFDVDVIDQEIAVENNEDELTALLALGGGVGKALDFDDSDYQTEFNFVRGNVLFSDNIGGPGNDFDRFDLTLRMKIADDEDVFLKTSNLSFSYVKSGDFTIAGKDVQAHMFEYDIERADFTLTISTAQNNIGINGGVTYYDGLEFEIVNLHVVSGVFGIGQDVLYVGLMGEGELTEELGGQVGASILIGRINQSSETVLINHGFADLVERVPLEDALTGVYVRALGTIPIVNDGCMLSLYVGGEVEIWYFTSEADDVYGGSIRGFAYGDALCVISARGDVTLSFYKTETPDGQPAHRFEGDAWVCGGIGFDCDPGTWGPNWSERWWDDSWCWQAGAAAEVIWQSGDGWDYSLDADYE